MTPSEIKNILELQKKWMNSEDGGVRADLQGADMCDVILSNVDLSGADLSGAKLNNAVLRGADLSYAELINADLAVSILRKIAPFSIRAKERLIF